MVTNPDEAELLAGGKRAMASLVPYRDYTSPTFLFGWPLALGLLGRLGVALTLPTAHFLSAMACLYLSVGALAVSLLLVASTALDGPGHRHMHWGALIHPSQAVPGAAVGPAWDTIRSECPPGRGS